MVMYQLIGGGGNPIEIGNYLTIVALEDGLTAKLSTNDCEYCIDGDGNWKTLSAATNTETINTGHTLSFRGNLTPNSSSGIGTFTISKSCNLEGNCMSMLFGDYAASNISLSGKNYAFYYLFKDCTTIKSVSSGFLPATTLSSYCYYCMFYGCTNLTTTPELPATILASYCYSNMLYSCTSLTQAPELPATTLADSCYRDMFENCSNLTQAPSLPATTLASYCYFSMFWGCTNLTQAPSLPATTLADSCYRFMFDNCTSLVQAPELPATTLADYCYDYMFYGCTSLTTAPELPATTLASYCYNDMFSSCTNLTQAPELPVTTLAEDCYYGMFSSCTNLTQAPELPATTLASNCYRRMFRGCTNLTQAPELPATTLAFGCYNEMFRDCTSLTTAPTLPAMTLANGCYESMFEGCTKLNYISAMFTTKPSTLYTDDWVSGVASSGTFVKNQNATWNVRGVYGIPSGWTVVLGGYTVNLNNQWRLSSNISNPNSSLYDGVYESYSNYNISSGTATMTIKITGYTSFSVYIRSYAESSRDYVMISQLDKSITGDTSYSSSDVKAHTRGNQQSGTAISNYTLVEYTNIDGGDHTITIVYRKDGSINRGNDRGYVLIPK